MSTVEYIRGQLPRGELLCQLSEEASELSKAALKLRRAEDGTNPTPVSVEEAEENLLEEIGDILNALEVLDIDFFGVYSDGARLKKMRRWSERLEEAAEKKELAQLEADLEEDPLLEPCPF